VKSRAIAIAALTLAGCGPTLDEQRAENRVLDAIAPGTYSNVARSADGSLYGIELALPRGSDSVSLDIVRCDQLCGDVQHISVRRGLNGLFFELPGDGQGHGPTLVALSHDGNAVEFSADTGDGLKSIMLPRVSRPIVIGVTPA
jgi:hypothetical protein